MLKVFLLTTAAVSIAAAIAAHQAPRTASAEVVSRAPGAVPMADITWMCCYYLCTTTGGPTHDTAFCHPSTIGPECPQTPAPSEAAQECTLVAERPAESCDDCVSQDP